MVWPELDKLLLDEDDTSAATPYKAAVLEYRVVVYDQLDKPPVDHSLNGQNGHAVFDAQHPCRYCVSDLNFILLCYVHISGHCCFCLKV